MTGFGLRVRALGAEADLSGAGVKGQPQPASQADGNAIWRIAAGQSVTLLVSPILTRLYDPADFGLYAVFTAISAILGAVLALRYEAAIPLAPTERQAGNMAALCLVVTVLVSLVSVPLIWVSSAWLERVTQMPGLATMLWLLPATMVLAGLEQLLSFWSVYRGTFRLNAASRVVQSLVQSVLQVVLGIAGAGPFGLVSATPWPMEFAA